jgi:hypothetical protein
MPKIDKILTLEIKPEQFLENCSLLELQEIELLVATYIRRKELELNNLKKRLE